MVLPSQADRVHWLDRDDYAQRSVFLPTNLLRESRRQRQLESANVPSVCVLDPDGDIVRHLAATKRAERADTWACYHTELWETEIDGGERVGIVPSAVGAPFAVLVAEELFASGCQLLVSVTSAGKIDGSPHLPEILLISRALRGEGTSYAYLPPAPAVDADTALVAAVVKELQMRGQDCAEGISWTTDAPFRETGTALAIAEKAGAAVVEMEAAGLYAFAQAHKRAVICFAHLTNTMGVSHDDFEKGPANGAVQAMVLVSAAITAWRCRES